MIKKLAIVLAIITLFAVSIGVVAAQGNGNGKGNGRRVCDPEQSDNCLGVPQLNAYNNGGIGFVNPQTGAQWNGQQRGQMRRGAGMNGTGLYLAMPPAYDGELPQEVIDLMIEGWLDEQQAYAVYETFIAEFGEEAPFVNIQRAEEQHIAAWEFLFDRYAIETLEIPDFDISAVASFTDACTVAIDAEIANFSLYDTMLETFGEYPDIYQVALALRNASEFNHLPAFQNCAN